MHDIEIHRKKWAAIAKKHGWYKTPFFVQVWRDPATNRIYDSVSFIGLTADIVIHEAQDIEGENENA